MDGKYGLDSKPWSKVDVVYAPVNVNLVHWVAIAIHLRKRKVLIYDSLYDHINRPRSTRSSGTRIPFEVNAICEALRMTCCNGEWKAEYADWNEYVPKQSPG